MGCFLTNTAIINPSIKPIQTGPPTKAETPKKENKLKVPILVPSKNVLNIFFFFFCWLGAGASVYLTFDKVNSY